MNITRTITRNLVKAGEVVNRVIRSTSTKVIKSYEVVQLTINGFRVNEATVGQYGSKEFNATTDIDWNNGNVQFVQLASGEQALTFVNALGTGRYILILIQPQSGAKGTVIFPANIKWTANLVPRLTLTNGKEDLITLIYRAETDDYRGNYSLNY